MNVAVIHDWLATWGGSEQALAEILSLYPEAVLFAPVDFLSPQDRVRLGGRPVRTSFLQHVPRARSSFRNYLPLFPRAIESFDVSGFDVVISSSHAFAKGVRTGADQLHICYCYTPMRYAWDLRDQYLAQTGLDGGLRGVVVRRVLARLRAWDRAASARVNHFVAISSYIADRISRCYDRSSTVIYPPVAVAAAPVVAPAAPRRAYVTVSRLVPYKRVDVIAAAFRHLPDRELVIIGDGPDQARVVAEAGPNVRLLGRTDDATRDRWLGDARAFIFAAEEDFGIAPLEAQARGTPVIAFGRGGAAETIRGLETIAPTGVFFDAQTPAAIAEAVRRFEASGARITAAACRANAARFSVERFRSAFAAFVEARWSEFAGAPIR